MQIRRYRKPSYILREAARVIEAGRWTQGKYVRKIDGQECYCALGAIVRCSAGVKETNQTGEFAQVVRKPIKWLAFVTSGKDINPTGLTKHATNYVAVWNDAPSRRRHHVVARLRRAAALAEAAGE